MTGDNFVCAPILLIGFNRPDYMVEQIEALRPARPNKIYLAVDGPRADRPEESALCQQVRDSVKFIDWPCEIKTLFRDRNLGCKYGVSGAITWFFDNEAEGVILEDDCRPTQDFLRFASEMLERYRDDERIGAICGFNFFNLQTDNKASYHFSRHMDVWGWASWRRVWKDYDIDICSNTERALAIVASSDMTPYNKKVFRKFVFDVANGLSTWDVQLALLLMERKSLTIIPRERLTVNVGFSDDRATHTAGYVFWNTEWSTAGGVSFPLSHPLVVLRDEKADTLHDKLFGAIFPRALTFIGCKFPVCRKVIDSIYTIVKGFLLLLNRCQNKGTF